MHIGSCPSPTNLLESLRSRCRRRRSSPTRTTPAQLEPLIAGPVEQRRSKTALFQTLTADRVERLGRPGGLTITNIETVLRDLDDLLNNGRPPAIEYIHMENYLVRGVLPIPNPNVFGHAALRYRLPKKAVAAGETFGGCAADGTESKAAPFFKACGGTEAKAKVTSRAAEDSVILPGITVNDKYAQASSPLSQPAPSEPQQQQMPHRRQQPEPAASERVIDCENLGHGRLGVFVFTKPEEFYYGTSGYREFNYNHGVYNRNVIGLRIEEVDEEVLEKLHEYMVALEEEAREGRVGFAWIGRERGRNSNCFRCRQRQERSHGMEKLRSTSWRSNQHKDVKSDQCSSESLASEAPTIPQTKSDLRRTSGIGKPIFSEKKLDGPVIHEQPSRCCHATHPAGPEPPGRSEVGHFALTDTKSGFIPRGNCTQWITRALVHAGVLRHPRSFPKRALIDLLKGGKNCCIQLPAQRRSNGDNDTPGNIHLVTYRRVGHAAHTYTSHPRNISIGSLTGPLHLRTDMRFYNLKRKAHVTVTVKKGSDTAECIVRGGRVKRNRERKD